MDNNNLALLRLLKAHLNQATPDLTDIPFEREALLRLARIHDVEAMVCSQLQLSAGSEQTDKRKDHLMVFAATIMRAFRMTEIQQTLSGLFAEAGIDHLYFKGPVVAQYYPVPELRTMGDIDVLVRPEDREKAIAILTAHGAAEVESSIAVSEYIFDGGAVELHTNMIHEEVETDFDFQDYFAGAWAHTSPTEKPFVWQLDATFHLIYVIVHLAKHFHDRGSGVRMFMDVAVLLEKQIDMLDLNNLMRQLEEMHLDRFFKRLLFLNRRWFGTSTGIPEEDISEAAFGMITEYVLAGGVFGYEATPLENVALRKLYHRNKEASVKSSAMKLFFKTVFPSHKQLERLGYAPFKRNRKLLTPFVWIYRWIYCLLTKSGDVKARLRQLSNISEEKVYQIVKQERIIQDMGL